MSHKYSILHISLALRDDAVIWFLLLAGTVLRLLWPADMEWKFDEIWMYERAIEYARSGQWPSIGMMSSAGIVNPGLSMWIFILLGYFTATPIEMVQAVQWLNVLSLWGSYFVFRKAISGQESGPWFWGIALAAVSPLGIVFSRKIWAQCLLPPFCLFFLAGHLYRQRRWGIFLWGFSGALLGQIHMSGFFLTAAFLLWTIWWEAREKGWHGWRSLNWPSWLLGTAVGAVGLIPWFMKIVPVRRNLAGALTELLTLKFYTQWWGAAFGVNLKYSLSGAFWSEFLQEPHVLGVPIYFVAVAHLFLIGCGLAIVTRWLIRRPMVGSSPTLQFYLSATLLGTGILMTVSGIRVYAHYLIVLFPIVHLWVADRFYRVKPLLFAICLAQLFLSMSFLNYIHRNGGVPSGEYGPAFRIQKYSVPSEEPLTKIESNKG